MVHPLKLYRAFRKKARPPFIPPLRGWAFPAATRNTTHTGSSGSSSVAGMLCTRAQRPRIYLEAQDLVAWQPPFGYIISWLLWYGQWHSGFALDGRGMRCQKFAEV